MPKDGTSTTPENNTRVQKTMIRRISLYCITAMIATGCLAVDANRVEAQGLLRRIQSRIQARTQSSPQYRQPYRQPSPRPNYQTPQASNNYNVPPSRLQPQRVSPIGPSAKPTAPGNPPATGQPAPGGTPNQPNQFGSSILSQSGADKPANSQSPASLGIDVFQFRGPKPGVSVASFRNDSLADEAGLRKGDVIVSIDGKPTPTIADVASQVKSRNSGEKLAVEVVRGNQPVSLTIPLVNRTFTSAKPSMASKSKSPVAKQPVDFGVSVVNAPRMRGSIVTAVKPGTPAAAAGIRVDDRIVSINGRLLRDSEAFRAELTQYGIDDEIAIQIVRNEELLAADVRLNPSVKTPASNITAGGGKSDSSVMKGLGSMIGGFFGSEKAKEQSSDPMALGDEEPIEQVGFEQDLNGKKQKKSKLESDPPSLDTIELPAPDPVDSASPGAANKGNARLQDEIRRLEERLKEIEAENEKS